MNARRGAAAALSKDVATDPRKVDIFSYGALLVKLYTGKNLSAIRSVVQLLESIEDRDVQVIVMKCLEKDPAHRPSARSVQNALRAIQGGEQVSLEPSSFDPSVASALVEEEELAEAEQEAGGAPSPVRGNLQEGPLGPAPSVPPPPQSSREVRPKRTATRMRVAGATSFPLKDGGA